MKLISKIFIVTLIVIGFGHANEIKVFDFTEKELSKLDVRKVRGAENNTVYSIGSNENGNFLKAVADNAASGLGKEIKIDLNKTPFINITWKIEKDLQGINENTKKDMILLLGYLQLKKQVLLHSQIEQLIMFFRVIMKLDLIHQVLIQKSQ